MRCRIIRESRRELGRTCQLLLQLLLFQSLSSAALSDISILRYCSLIHCSLSTLAAWHLKPISWVPSRCWIMLCRICHSLGFEASDPYNRASSLPVELSQRFHAPEHSTAMTSPAPKSLSRRLPLGVAPSGATAKAPLLREATLNKSTTKHKPERKSTALCECPECSPS